MGVHLGCLPNCSVTFDASTQATPLTLATTTTGTQLMPSVCPVFTSTACQTAPSPTSAAFSQTTPLPPATISIGTEALLVLVPEVLCSSQTRPDSTKSRKKRGKTSSTKILTRVAATSTACQTTISTTSDATTQATLLLPATTSTGTQVMQTARPEVLSSPGVHTSHVTFKSLEDASFPTERRVATSTPAQLPPLWSPPQQLPPPPPAPTPWSLSNRGLLNLILISRKQRRRRAKSHSPKLTRAAATSYDPPPCS